MENKISSGFLNIIIRFNNQTRQFANKYFGLYFFFFQTSTSFSASRYEDIEISKLYSSNAIAGGKSVKTLLKKFL